MKVYGLVGKTLQHSFSANFFSDYFVNENIVAKYQNFELKTIEDIQSVFDLQPAGLNVTIPYKESVIPFLDELDPIAEKIGAVNTIVFDGDKKIGYNTDAFGFKQAIKPFLNNQHERALIFGTGSAAKAVASVLKEIGVDVIFISRNPLGKNKHFNYSEVNLQMLNACKLMVNCTPVGTFPNSSDYLPLPYEGIGKDHLVIDLIYNPIKSMFLQKAENQGATIMNGEGMLKAQAMKSWSLWNN
ncbi:MAG: shikimate dehydrogenase [Crocinitomicaceae bacterium]|nr:shikimate dehydrogenase [Crocinitomicaceae bacterium]